MNIPSSPRQKTHPATHNLPRALRTVDRAEIHIHTPRHLNNEKVTLARMKVKRWGRRHFYCSSPAPKGTEHMACHAALFEREGSMGS